jgi:hypothetical protein
MSSPIVTKVSPSNGPNIGGTIVTVSGQGFVPKSAVYFGGTSALAVNFINSGECSAIAPPTANAGPVNITVHNEGLDGGSANSLPSAADVFTYFDYPSVASVSMNPSILWAGGESRVTVTLKEPAPADTHTTVVVTISGASGVSVPGVTAQSSEPIGIEISVGSTTVNFGLAATPSAAGTVSISAAISPNYPIHAPSPPVEIPVTAAFDVYSGQIVLTPPLGETLTSGQVLDMAVVVRNPAPSSGGLVTLTTNHPTAVRIPATVALPAGATRAAFTLTALTLPESQEIAGVTITASYGSWTSAPFTVKSEPSIIRHPPPPPHGHTLA